MEEESKTIYCCDRPNDNSALWAALMSGKQESPAELATLLNNNNMMNNPFFYLIFLMLFRNGFWGNGEAAAANANADINRLSAQVADNNNTQLLMDAVKGDSGAIATLSSNLNCDFNTLQTACCSIKSAIEKVGGEVGYTSEKVINAVNLGDANIVSKLQECCCSTKTAIQQMGYENQLATERQTNTLSSQMASNHSQDQLQQCQNHGSTMSRIDQLANGVQQGFAQIGYQMATDKCDIINAGTANTQRIIDTLNTHWQNETQLALQDAKFKNSQLEQNQYIASLIKSGGCNC